MRQFWDADDVNSVKAFTRAWIDKFVQQLSRATMGDPKSTLEEEIAIDFFQALLNGGALPVSLLTTHGKPPDPWDYVEAAVKEAYAAHDRTELWTEAAAKAKARVRAREIKAEAIKAEAMKAKAEVDANLSLAVKSETMCAPLTDAAPSEPPRFH